MCVDYGGQKKSSLLQKSKIAATQHRKNKSSSESSTFNCTTEMANNMIHTLNHGVTGPQKLHRFDVVDFRRQNLML